MSNNTQSPVAAFRGAITTRFSASTLAEFEGALSKLRDSLSAEGHVHIVWVNDDEETYCADLIVFPCPVEGTLLH